MNSSRLLLFCFFLSFFRRVVGLQAPAKCAEFLNQVRSLDALFAVVAANEISRGCQCRDCQCRDMKLWCPLLFTVLRSISNTAQSAVGLQHCSSKVARTLWLAAFWISTVLVEPIVAVLSNMDSEAIFSVVCYGALVHGDATLQANVARVLARRPPSATKEALQFSDLEGAIEIAVTGTSVAYGSADHHQLLMREQWKAQIRRYQDVAVATWQVKPTLAGMLLVLFILFSSVLLLCNFFLNTGEERKDFWFDSAFPTTTTTAITIFLLLLCIFRVLASGFWIVALALTFAVPQKGSAEYFTRGHGDLCFTNKDTACDAMLSNK